VLALDTNDGKTLWHAGQGAPMQSSPITYELDGRQYVLTSSGGVLFAWALPEPGSERPTTTAVVTGK
jgi:alcohol dehydrogenase (cytochrome c)